MYTPILSACRLGRDKREGGEGGRKRGGGEERGGGREGGRERGREREREKERKRERERERVLSLPREVIFTENLSSSRITFIRELNLTIRAPQAFCVPWFFQHF